MQRMDYSMKSRSGVIPWVWGRTQRFGPLKPASRLGGRGMEEGSGTLDWRLTMERDMVGDRWKGR